MTMSRENVISSEAAAVTTSRPGKALRVLFKVLTIIVFALLLSSVMPIGFLS